MAVSYFKNLYSALGVISPADPTRFIYQSVNPIIDGMRRKSDNCASLIRFLFECDDPNIDWRDQAALWVNNDIPLMSLTYSGNKSVHAIVELSDNGFVENIEHYKQIHNKLRLYFEDLLGIKLDKAVNDPSHLTRNPNAINEKTGKKQAALICNELKLPIGLMNIDFSYRPYKENGYLAQAKKNISRYIVKLPLSAFELKGIRGELEKGTRNNSICSIAGTLKKKGYSISDFEYDLYKVYPDMKSEIKSIITRFR